MKGGQEAYNAQFLFENGDKGRCGKDLGIDSGKDHKKNRYESEYWRRVVKHADIRERNNRAENCEKRDRNGQGLQDSDYPDSRLVFHFSVLFEFIH